MSYKTALHYIDLVMTGDFKDGIEHQKYKISGKLFKKIIALIQRDHTVIKFEKYLAFEERRIVNGNKKETDNSG